jgi:AsmA protein
VRKKFVVISIVSIAAVLAAVAIAVSLLVNIDQFRPQLARAIGASLGRDVTIGHISLSLFSGNAAVDDITIADDPAFSATPFVTARSVRIGIALLPLITSKHLQVESFQLHRPQLTLRRSAAGIWNFSTLGAASSSEPSGGATASSSNLTFSIGRLAITDAHVVITTTDSKTPAVYEHLDVDVRDFSPTSAFRFAAMADVPGGGMLKSTGHAGPLNATGLGSTPFDATLDGTRIDLARAGIVDPSAGPGGLIDLHLRMKSTGRSIATTATLRADRFVLVSGAAPALQPLEAKLVSDYNLSTHDGTLGPSEVRVGRAAVRLTGRYSTRAASPIVQLSLSGHRMPVTDVQSTLPAVGVTLPNGAHFRNGTLDTDLTVRGPLDRLVVAGPVAMTDATLSGFDIGSRLQTIASLAGYSRTGETTIESLRVVLRVAPDGIRADDLATVLPALGRLQGGGTIAPNGALDFKMVATLKRMAGGAGQLVQLVSFGHPESGIPFRVSGTTSSPVFAPDVARVAADAVKSPGTISKATGFMRSLFGAKR